MKTSSEVKLSTTKTKLLPKVSMFEEDSLVRLLVTPDMTFHFANFDLREMMGTPNRFYLRTNLKLKLEVLVLG